MKLAEQDRIRLAECESTIGKLAAQLLVKDDLIAAMTTQIHNLHTLSARWQEVEMKLEVAQIDLGKVQKAYSETLTTNSAQAAQITRLEAEVAKLEKTTTEQARTIESLRYTLVEQLKAVESKYQTARQINMQLEAKIVGLYTELEEQTEESGHPRVRGGGGDGDGDGDRRGDTPADGGGKGDGVGNDPDAPEDSKGGRKGERVDGGEERTGTGVMVRLGKYD
ncbi:hypothetical protein HK102_002792 [Quaeritorhiza haematococci]|nr:hypothetical protein HK102_002792 [Quaeritorhiza haematococci]